MGVLLAVLLACVQDEKPKVLFYSDPQKSDNAIVRRPKPDVLSTAEKHFVEMTKGIFDVTTTQDGSVLTAAKLKDWRAVVMFTALQPPADKEALVAWVRDGGAFVGIHSAANTFQGYAPFGEMLGAFYDTRPWRTKEKPLAKARFRVEDPRHAATRHLPETFELEDDLYTYKNFQRSRVKVLLSMEPESLDLSKTKHRDFPVSWTREHGKGRVFYTMLGDSEPVWKDERYRTHLLGGLKWTLER
jgi:uncharacterized protein